MTSKVKQLFHDLSLRKISSEKFLKEYSKYYSLTNEYILSLLDKGILEQSDEDISGAITLISIGSFSKIFYSKKLCELLRLSFHTEHESIAMLLKDILDLRTIDCLYSSAELKFDYLDYDETYQFARKCIKAISAINDENAIDKLKLLSNSNSKNNIIAEYARKELRCKEI